MRTGSYADDDKRCLEWLLIVAHSDVRRLLRDQPEAAARLRDALEAAVGTVEGRRAA